MLNKNAYVYKKHYWFGHTNIATKIEPKWVVLNREPVLYS